MAKVTSILLSFLILAFAADSWALNVKISGFSNIALGSWAGSGDLYGENSLCVYNQAGSNYRIRARGAGAGYAFELAGVGGSIAYEVRFKQSSGSYIELSTNTFQSYSNANTSADDCGGISNATMEVRATAAALSSALSGSYSGTLTILLEPN